MYSLVYSQKFIRQLKKLDKSLQERVISTLERIRIRPYSSIKKLSGTPYSRLRVGNYRIILNVKNNELIIHVIEVGPRKKIYKK